MATEAGDQLNALWQVIENGKKDAESTQKMRQIYSSAAELYHEFRPRYPESMIDEAIQSAPLLKRNPNAKILELGCGPGTLTLPLAKRGFNLVSIDPGVGMIEKAREVCKDFSNVAFRTESFKEFITDEKYDAIVAASSMHWALADNDRDGLIEKMSTLLKDGGSLVLFWNFSCEPSKDVSDKLAEELKDRKPFYFRNRSFNERWISMNDRVLGPIEASPFFAKFTTTEYPGHEDIPVESFINLLKTTSVYISLEDEERESNFAIVRKILRQECGEMVPMSRMSMFNISHKRK